MAATNERHHHVVYVGQDNSKRFSVYIHAENLDTHMDARHCCHIYYPDHSTGTVRERRLRFSPKIVFEELGWFSDPRLFGPICTNLPVPVNQDDQNATFHAWKTALVQELDVNHAAHWTRNRL
jgi:hypothetical protein